MRRGKTWSPMRALRATTIRAGRRVGAAADGPRNLVASTLKSVGVDAEVDDLLADDRLDLSQTRIAAEWYKRATVGGHCKAMYNLADCMGADFNRRNVHKAMVKACKRQPGNIRVQQVPIKLHTIRFALQQLAVFFRQKGKCRRARAQTQHGKIAVNGAAVLKHYATLRKRLQLPLVRHESLVRDVLQVQLRLHRRC